MGPGKALARLTAKILNYGQCTPGTLAIAKFTQDDVAFGLAGATRLESLIVRVKWTADRSSVKPLCNELVREFELYAKRKRWYIKRKDVIKRMTVAMLLELEIVRRVGRRILPGPEVCGKCKGRKHRFSKQKSMWFPCVKCKSTGRPFWDEEARAKYCRMRTARWRDTWSPRYRLFGSFVAKREARGLEHVIKRCLRGSYGPV